MRVHVIINHSSGRDRATDRRTLGKVGELLGDHDIEATLEIADPRQLRHSVRAALGRRIDALLVGGGDGTASTAARMMVADGRPLGVLPIGTHNHFARDLGIAASLEGAVAAIARGDLREVDVGEVNGHVFVNNATLGLYPDVVLLRELDRATTGAGRWSAYARAVWRATGRSSPVEVDIVSDGHRLRRRTSFLLVGNNRYELGLPAIGRRSRLDGGELALYVSGVVGRLGLVRLGIEAALGGGAVFDVVRAKALVVRARERRLRLSVDGEVIRLAPPLRYRSRPRALRVFAPPLVAREPERSGVTAPRAQEAR